MYFNSTASYAVHCYYFTDLLGWLVLHLLVLLILSVVLHASYPLLVFTILDLLPPLLIQRFTACIYINFF